MDFIDTIKSIKKGDNYLGVSASVTDKKSRNTENYSLLQFMLFF